VTFLLNDNLKVGLIQTGISLFLLVSVFIYAKKNLKVNRKYRVVEINKDSKKFKILILFLSKEENTDKYKDIESFEELINSRSHRWAMPVVAIKEHMNTLKEVQVITSSETEGQFSQFKNLIEKLFPKRTFSISHGGSADFNNLEEVQEVVEACYEDILKKGYKEKDVVVDITSGTKIASVGASAVTVVHPERYFQYVKERNGRKEVVVFNVDVVE
jgi:hypothetical protein